MLRHFIAKLAFFAKLYVLTAPAFLVWELLVTRFGQNPLGRLGSSAPVVAFAVWVLFAAFLSSFKWWDLMLWCLLQANSRSPKNFSQGEPKRDAAAPCRWARCRSSVGVTPSPATGSLQPVAVGAAAEVTKPSKPSRRKGPLRRSREQAGRNASEHPTRPRKFCPGWTPTPHLCLGEGRRRWRPGYRLEYAGPRAIGPSESAGV